jgi:protein-tyrosine phosphatase
MRPTLYTADQPGPGRLSFMAKPRGGDWLPDEMAALKATGVDVLVCALTPGELREVGLDSEPQAARQAGLSFTAIPIPDRAVPDLPAVLPALRQLAGQLHDGAHIVTQCRFGIGRSALLAASLLILNGASPDTAWRHLQEARGVPIPDTPAQRNWPSSLIGHRQGPGIGPTTETAG